MAKEKLTSLQLVVPLKFTNSVHIIISQLISDKYIVAIPEQKWEWCIALLESLHKTKNHFIASVQKFTEQSVKASGTTDARLAIWEGYIQSKWPEGKVEIIVLFDDVDKVIAQNPWPIGSDSCGSVAKHVEKLSRQALGAEN